MSGRGPEVVVMRKSTPPHNEAGTPPGGEVTEFLRAWSDGDRAALDRMTPIVYGELQGLALPAAYAQDRGWIASGGNKSMACCSPCWNVRPRSARRFYITRAQPTK